MTLLPVLTGGRGAPRALGLILSPSPGGGCLASQRLPCIPLPSYPSQGPRAAGPEDPQEGIVPSPPPHHLPQRGPPSTPRTSVALSYPEAHQDGKTERRVPRHSRPLPLTMSVTLRPPNEKAMALGGVATGSMKARELARVQGSMT